MLVEIYGSFQRGYRSIAIDVDRWLSRKSFGSFYKLRVLLGCPCMEDPCMLGPCSRCP